MVLHLPDTYKVLIPLHEATDRQRIRLFRGYRLYLSLLGESIVFSGRFLT